MNTYLSQAYKRFGFKPFRILKAMLVFNAMEQDLREEGLWDLPLNGENLQRATTNSLAFIMAKAITGASSPLEKMAAIAALQKATATYTIKWAVAKDMAETDPHWYLLPLGLPDDIKAAAIAGQYKTIGDIFMASPVDFL